MQIGGREVACHFAEPLQVVIVDSPGASSATV